MTWRLQPLLELRRRQEAAATTAFGRALASRLRAESEAQALRERAQQTAARSLFAGTGAEGARWRSRLRQESDRLRGQAVAAAARSQLEAEAAAARRDELRRAALGRELVEQLEAAWRRAKDLAAARRAEAALDDRPWRRDPGLAS
jgi:hypothetical protein